MKRNIVIAVVTAAALVGGGTATALAVAGDDDDTTSVTRTDDDRDDRGVGDEGVVGVARAAVDGGHHPAEQRGGGGPGPPGHRLGRGAPRGRHHENHLFPVHAAQFGGEAVRHPVVAAHHHVGGRIAGRGGVRKEAHHRAEDCLIMAGGSRAHDRHDGRTGEVDAVHRGGRYATTDAGRVRRCVTTWTPSADRRLTRLVHVCDIREICRTVNFASPWRSAEMTNAQPAGSGPGCEGGRDMNRRTVRRDTNRPMRIDITPRDSVPEPGTAVSGA